MNIKNFLKTNDNFTNEDLKIILNLLDLTRISLTNSIKSLIDSIDCSDVRDLKAIDCEIKRLQKARETCYNFYYSLEIYLFNEEWGKYL